MILELGIPTWIILSIHPASGLELFKVLHSSNTSGLECLVGAVRGSCGSGGPSGSGGPHGYSGPSGSGGLGSTGIPITRVWLAQWACLADCWYPEEWFQVPDNFLFGLDLAAFWMIHASEG